MKWNKRAFTLIEVIIGLIIFSIITIVIYNFMVNGNKQFLEGKNISESIQNIRLIMEYLQYDINRMQKLKTTKLIDNWIIDFELKDGTKVKYTFDIKKKKLKREEGNILKKAIKWAGIQAFYLKVEIRAFDKNGKFLKKYVSPDSSTLNDFPNNVTIDLSHPKFYDAYQEFSGIKVKIISSFYKQKKNVYLERYIFPTTSNHKVTLQWVY